LKTTRCTPSRRTCTPRHVLRIAADLQLC
jgi:hypothetical protein